MTSRRSNWWYCCSGCTRKLAPFSGLFKELLSHRTPECRLLVFRQDGGLANVKLEGGKFIYQFPDWVTPALFQDEGRTSYTSLAYVYCTYCDKHVGWKIMDEFSGHPIIRPGQYILKIDAQNEIIHWDRPTPQ